MLERSNSNLPGTVRGTSRLCSSTTNVRVTEKHELLFPQFRPRKSFDMFLSVGLPHIEEAFPRVRTSLANMKPQDNLIALPWILQNLAS